MPTRCQDPADARVACDQRTEQVERVGGPLSVSNDPTVPVSFSRRDGRWHEQQHGLPATITTTESFPANTPTARLDFEVQMRLRADAIRCTYSRARNLGSW